MSTEALGAGGPLRIKLCGLSREADVAAANEARPDFAGFVVNVARSRRNVEPERLAGLTGLLDPGIAAVGVFVDEDPALVARLASEARLAAVQLHGHEDEGYLAHLRGLLPPGVAVWKACNAAAREPLAAAADLVLFDNGSGGTGEAFDWGLLRGFAGRPFMLAGGLGPHNVARAVREVAAPALWGVDMSSGVETDGVKDPIKMKAAVAAVRSLDL